MQISRIAIDSVAERLSLQELAATERKVASQHLKHSCFIMLKIANLQESPSFLVGSGVESEQLS